MSEDGIYYLVAGGSIGAGKIQQLLDLMREALEEVEQAVVICGRNKKLEKKLRKRYAGYKNISIIGSTDQMATYMRACDVLYSKPGRTFLHRSGCDRNTVDPSDTDSGV